MAYSNFYACFYASLDKSKSAFRTIFHFKPSLVYLVFVVFWQIIVWLQAWFISRNLSGDILVLHYNVDFGIDLVGNPIRIYLFPVFGLGIFLINFLILAILAKDKNFKILAHVLLATAAIFGLFLSIALIAVYLINFR